jgi:ribosomal protein S18 acetylase RimI-like enzyme
MMPSSITQFRKKGFGQALVNYGLGEAQELDTNRVEIGLISAHTELQGWYRQMGFSVQEVVQFKHLPFEVTCMVREI